MVDELALLAEVEREVANLPPQAGRIIEVGATINDPLHRLEYYIDRLEWWKRNEATMERTIEQPVDPATFLDDPYFLGNIFRPWPVIRESIIEACNGQYMEAVFTGSIGTGKTTAALGVMAYGLYQVLLLRDPHAEFDMDPNSEISFIMQSVTGGTAFTVDYMRMRRMLENSPWFNDNAPFDRERKASIRFQRSPIMVEPLPGTETAAIGENVMGGLIDEVNHMQVIRKSSRTQDGGTWDQMMQNYRAIARRRESRFMRDGRVLGMLCLVGSANYAGQFTDRKREERDRQLERDGKTNIYVFDKRPWEVQPEGRFSRERFRVFLGDGTRKPRVISNSEKLHPNDEVHVMEVPEDYRTQFESDITGAVKDIAGIALHGFSNFIPNFPAIKKAFGERKNLFDPDWCDFESQPVRIPAHKIPNPKCPRYIHIDLSLSMDNAGFAMGHVPEFTVIDRGGGHKETLPVVQFDGLLSIRPAAGAQIPIHKIKKLVFTLHELGYPVEWVTLDGFQSADFIQTMIRSGFRSGVLSLDKKPGPYMTTKDAIIDGRVHGPDSALACTELRDLVWVSQNTKVDHPPDGSKDLSDCIGGVIHGLSIQKRIWVDFGVDPRQFKREPTP